MEHRENAKIFHLTCHQMPFWCGIRCKTFLENYGCGRVWAVPEFAGEHNCLSSTASLFLSSQKGGARWLMNHDVLELLRLSRGDYTLHTDIRYTIRADKEGSELSSPKSRIAVRWRFLPQTRVSQGIPQRESCLPVFITEKIAVR